MKYETTYPRIVSAVQFTSEDNCQDIVDFTASCGFTCDVRYSDGELNFSFYGQHLCIPEESWLVFDDGEALVLNDKAFKVLFTESSMTNITKWFARKN